MFKHGGQRPTSNSRNGEAAKDMEREVGAGALQCSVFSLLASPQSEAWPRRRRDASCGWFVQIFHALRHFLSQPRARPSGASAAISWDLGQKRCVVICQMPDTRRRCRRSVSRSSAKVLTSLTSANEVQGDK